MGWGLPSVEPPDYLVPLSPGLYRAERARVAARSRVAVQLAEQALRDIFARLVSHLAERISGVGQDGQPEIFRDSAVEMPKGLFARFREVDVRSDDPLDAPVAEAQRAVRGVGPGTCARARGCGTRRPSSSGGCTCQWTPCLIGDN